MRLTDADGGELWAKVTAIVGQSALLEWSLSAREGRLFSPDEPPDVPGQAG